MKPALILALCLLASPARAETWYVGCGHGFKGEGKGQAVEACKRARTEGSGFEACSCDEPDADVVTLSSSSKPAYFTTCFEVHEPTRAKALRACQKKRSTRRRQQDCNCGEALEAVYGPFVRKPRTDAYGDDSKLYVYLSQDGTWMDANGEWPCLVAGTPVWTPSGERAIETLSAGDLVLTWSMQRRELVEARIIRAKRRLVEQVFELSIDQGPSLQATGNHPLYVPAQAAWVRVDALQVGDEVAIVIEGQLATRRLARIGLLSRQVEVFDLSVAGEHSYIADGVWVHNY